MDPADVIEDRARESGGGAAPLGPTEEAGGDGFVRRYSTGNLYFHLDTWAHWVYGAILDEYLRIGGPAVLGYLVRDEEEAGPGWRVSNFQRGAIFWTAAHGAHVLRGDGLNQDWGDATVLAGGYVLLRSSRGVRILGSDGSDSSVYLQDSGEISPDRRTLILDSVQADMQRFHDRNRVAMELKKIDGVKVGGALTKAVWKAVLDLPGVKSVDTLLKETLGVSTIDLAEGVGEYYGAIYNDVVKVLNGEGVDAAQAVGIMAALAFTIVVPGARLIHLLGENGWKMMKDIGKAIGGALEDAVNALGLDGVADAVGGVGEDVVGLVGDAAESLYDIFD